MWFKRRGAGRLRRTLMLHWDPIGVAGVASARDEYDSYLGLVADHLRRGSSVEEIAALLESIRADRMGLRKDRRADVRAASGLKVWYADEMARTQA
jgi:hypothetical protein